MSKIFERKFGVSEAMESLARGKTWTLEDDDLNTLQWFEDDSEPPTLAEVEAEILRLHEDDAAKSALEEEARVNAELAKQSALAKLAALGLTEEEAKAIVGV